MPSKRARIPAPRRDLAIAALLVLSGAIGVGDEVVLARWLGLLLGHAATAQATVLATWMAGLGLGALWLGPGADQSRRPLLRYAALEAGAALLCALWPLLAGPLADASAGLPTWQRALALSWTLLPPALLLGGTLPAATRAAAHSLRAGGRTFGLLYAANSGGALIGALGVGVVGLGAVGMRASLGLLVALALLLAAAAALLARRFGEFAAGAPATATREVEDAPAIGPAAAAVPAAGGAPGAGGVGAATAHVVGWLLLALGGGATALALEGVTMRLLGLAVGASAYAFAGVVAVTVLGVTLGSAWARRHSGARRGRAALAATLAAYGWLLAVHLRAEHIGHGLAAGRHALATWTPWPGDLQMLLLQAAVTTLVALPSAAALGALLPLCADGLIVASGRVAGGAAWSLAANTVGAVLGAALAQPVVVPLLGLDGAWSLLLTGTGLLIVVAAVLARRPGRPVTAGRAPLLLVALFALGGPWALPRWDARLLHAGAFRGAAREPGDWSTFAARQRRSEVVCAEDGAEASVAVLRREGDLALSLQGKADASTRGDMLTQVLSAWLPMAAAARAERVLVIGMGSGVTAGVAAELVAAGRQADAATATDAPDRGVDVVELEPAVLRAARHFDPWSHGASSRADVQRHSDDARGWLLARPGARWDVIVSEPSNPWMAGNGNLFSRQWLTALRSRLRPGGVLAQWFHAYEMDDGLQAAVLATVAEVFPHVSLWTLHPGDLLMLASDAPIALVSARVERWLAKPLLAADLERLDVAGLPGLLSLQALDEATFHAAYRAQAGLEALDDDLPRLELQAPRALWRGDRALRLDALDQRRSWPPSATSALGRALAAAPSAQLVAERLLAQHSRFAAAPAAFRHGLVRWLLPRATADFLVSVQFSLLRERLARHKDGPSGRIAGHTDAIAAAELAAAVDARLAAWVASDGALPAETLRPVLLVQALDALLRDDPTAALASLRRCVALGDERLGRCEALLQAAPSMRRRLARRLLR